MACSVASEPLLLQRWCVCRLSLERRRGGHGTGCSVGTVAIRIGEAARWWCQDRVTALGMVAIRIGEVVRWWCQGWVTASGMVAMLIGKAVDGLQRGL